MRRPLMRGLLGLLAGFLGVSASMAADPRSLRLGDIEIVYDGERWNAEAAGQDGFEMRPVGTAARKLDPVHISKVPSESAEACTALARSRLSLYNEPTAAPIDIAGVRAIKLSAHSRCRNAMPQGVVVCAHHRGNSYLLTAGIASCRSGGANLFSGVDPVDELVRGLRVIP